MNYKHIPVMLNEVIDYLDPQPGQKFIDCTLGGGGYTFAIRDKIGTKGEVIAFDLDQDSIQNAEKIIKQKKYKNIILINENYRYLSAAVNKISNKKGKNKVNYFNGIVFDLGLSSHQLADRTRGFSFQLDAPLDMAFSRDENKKTKKIINKYKEKELEKIFKEYGEEKFSHSIARAVVKSRKEKNIETTFELVDIIRSAVPARYRNARMHCATKVFQALRIVSNNELKSLEEALPQALEVLKPGARIVVVSFHSLEDRIVKRFFKQESRDCVCPKEFPICQCNHKAKLKIITKKVLLSTEEEVIKNSRARSAKMRVAEIL